MHRTVDLESPTSGLILMSETHTHSTRVCATPLSLVSALSLSLFPCLQPHHAGMLMYEAAAHMHTARLCITLLSSCLSLLQVGSCSESLQAAGCQGLRSWLDVFRVCQVGRKSEKVTCIGLADICQVDRGRRAGSAHICQVGQRGPGGHTSAASTHSEWLSCLLESARGLTHWGAQSTRGFWCG
jgi:hypothetical protein